MDKTSKIFVSLSVITFVLMLGGAILGSNAKAKTKNPIIEVPEANNIKELESKKFINVTSENKTLTVYDVYSHKILVIEIGDDIEVIKLN